MGLGRFYKSLLKGNYLFGRRASGMITEDMTPGKARAVGTGVDIVAGVGLAAIFGSSTVGWGIAAVSAVVGIAAAPATVPAALATVAGAVLWGGLSVLMVSMGAGFLSSAMDNLNIPRPAAGKISYTAQAAKQAVVKPFKGVGNKLSHTFDKAHDGATGAQKKPMNNSQSKTASYKF